MMKRKKRILIGGSIVLIAAICGAIFLFSGKTQPTKSLAKQVEEDYTGIEEIINQAVEKNENLAMSSNPYEYVKNNSYYDRLVSKGISILPILEKKINENQYGDGLLGCIFTIFGNFSSNFCSFKTAAAYTPYFFNCFTLTVSSSLLFINASIFSFAVFLNFFQESPNSLTES